MDTRLRLNILPQPDDFMRPDVSACGIPALWSRLVSRGSDRGNAAPEEWGHAGGASGLQGPTAVFTHASILITF